MAGLPQRAGAAEVEPPQLPPRQLDQLGMLRQVQAEASHGSRCAAFGFDLERIASAAGANHPLPVRRVGHQQAGDVE